MDIINLFITTSNTQVKRINVEYGESSAKIGFIIAKIYRYRTNKNSLLFLSILMISPHF